MHNNYLMEQLAQISRKEVQKEFREVNYRQESCKSGYDTFDAAHYPQYVKRHVVAPPCCE
jgi:hypothetical protein